MGHKKIKVKDTDADLIFDLVYQNQHGVLDYLHCIRRVEQIKKNDKEVECKDYINKTAELEKEYLRYAPQAARNLLDSFLNLFPSFIPEAVIRAPTSKKQLQQPIFEVFQGRFPNMVDLSECFEKNPNSEEKTRLVPAKIGLLNSATRILIIDDVYAEGATIASIIVNCGYRKTYIIICPLLVESDQLFSRLKNATDEMINKMIRKTSMNRNDL